MRKLGAKAMTMILALMVFAIGWAMKAEALEPTLKWKKEFKYRVKNVDLATDTGDVILSLENGGEVILFDKDGNERFHWGPRIDRRAGGAGISKDGRYFVFYSGYTGTYADKKKVPDWSDDRIHFYNRQTKKELWNYKSPEGVPLISPDGSYVINYLMNDGFEVFNTEGRKTFEYRVTIFEFGSIFYSPDSNFIAVIRTIEQPLMLFKKDGTKVWERGRHNDIASISEGASYISTRPYVLAYDPPDTQNSHKGIVYDRNGNKVLEGFGILSGDGSKIAMHSPDKITIISLPDKSVIKEIPVQVNLPKVSNTFFAVFSYNGRYLVARKGNSILVFDLAGDISKEITAPTLGRFPEVDLTRDGKHLLIHSRERGYEKMVYYYQLY